MIERVDRAAKRILDCSIALVVLLALGPLWLVIAALIRLTSSGPAVFRMRNVVGKDGRQFTMLKFRTMYQDNDDRVHREAFARFARGEALADVAEAGARRPVYKLVDDPRVTPVGRMLRKTGLDEIPQLLNVLAGQMSIVGPRPSRDYEYQHYTPDQRRRFSVLPGITGLHQVTARSAVPFDEMVRLDLQYVDTRSVWLDLGIMARTARVLVRGRGAY